VRIRARHVALVVIAVVIAGVCVRLGFWQLDRLHGRRDINAMFAARGALPPVDLATADPARLPYAHVTVAGTYDTTHEIVLSGRSYQDVAGNHVLTPLVLDDGSAVLVDRGWVPLDTASPPVTGAAAAPTGAVTVAGLALPPDAISTSPTSPAPSVVVRIDLGRTDLPYRLVPVYVLLQTQDPPQASGVPVPVPPPTLDEGPHLSYALQWFAFATIAVVGCVVLLRHDPGTERE
jgi:surfeit locus 1 family protein